MDAGPLVESGQRHGPPPRRIGRDGGCPPCLRGSHRDPGLEWGILRVRGRRGMPTDGRRGRPLSRGAHDGGDAGSRRNVTASARPLRRDSRRLGRGGRRRTSADDRHLTVRRDLRRGHVSGGGPGPDRLRGRGRRLDLDSRPRSRRRCRCVRSGGRACRGHGFRTGLADVRRGCPGRGHRSRHRGCGGGRGRRGRGGRERWRRRGRWRRRRLLRRDHRGSDRRRYRGLGLGLGLGDGRGLTSRREQPERVDVSLLVRGPADAEMDARHGLLGRAARAHRPDGGTLAHRVALRNADLAEVDERDGVAVAGEDRDAAAVGRQRAGERDDAGRRRPHRRPFGPTDVHPSVLPGREDVRAEVEGPQNRPVGRPRPRGSRGGEDERERDREADRENPVHCAPPSFSATATRRTKGSGAVGRRQSARSSEPR